VAAREDSESNSPVGRPGASDVRAPNPWHTHVWAICTGVVNVLWIVVCALDLGAGLVTLLPFAGLLRWCKTNHELYRSVNLLPHLLDLCRDDVEARRAVLTHTVVPSLRPRWGAPIRSVFRPRGDADV
jgi:hypothetical protein